MLPIDLLRARTVFMLACGLCIASIAPAQAEPRDFEAVRDGLFRIDEGLRYHDVVFQRKRILPVEPEDGTGLAGSNAAMGAFARRDNVKAMDLISWKKNEFSDNRSVRHVWYGDATQTAIWNTWNNSGCLQSAEDHYIQTMDSVNYLYTFWGYPWSWEFKAENVSNLRKIDNEGEIEWEFDLRPIGLKKTFHVVLSQKHDFFPRLIQVLYKTQEGEFMLSREYKVTEFMELSPDRSNGLLHWFPKCGELIDTVPSKAMPDGGIRPPIEITILSVNFNREALSGLEMFDFPRGCILSYSDLNQVFVDGEVSQQNGAGHIPMDQLAQGEMPGYFSRIIGGGISLAAAESWVEAHRR
jgi:hypothetical protein